MRPLHRSLAILAGCFTVAWFACPAVPVAAGDADFKTVRRQVLPKLKSRKTPDKLAALAKLAAFPTTEAADLIVKGPLGDPAEAVRKAARDTLIGFHEHPEIGTHLLSQLSRSANKSGLTTATGETLWVLGAFTTPEIDKGVARFLDDALNYPQDSLLFFMTLIDDMGRAADANAMQAIELMSGAEYFSSNFGYRRCIVQAATRVRAPEAITFLIALLPKTEGLIQHDVVQHLTNATKQKFLDDPGAWRVWWEKNKNTFKFPPEADLAKDENIDGKAPAYHGIPICAKRVLFLLDTSKSMQGGAIEAAKRELTAAIQQLPVEVYFNVIMFDRGAFPWQTKMVRADSGMKELASRAIAEKPLGLGTASFAALKAAFQMDPEAIYFLSDGAPTDGPRDAIVQTISEANRTRRISLHSIGFGAGRPAEAVLAEFMRSLALGNYGRFRPVDQ